VQLVEGYRTRLTGMTGDEAEALFLSGLPGPAAELGLGTVVTAARWKVLAALPSELRVRASRLVERFYLDAAGWFRTGESVPHLAAVAEAVWEGRRLWIEYERDDVRVERVLEPLGLVLKAGIWYAVASVEGEVRTYRLSRIVAARTLEERFERPTGFDLASHWSESIAAYEREVPRIDVTVRVAPARLDALADLLGSQVVADAERLAEPDPHGWTRLVLRLDYPHDAPGRLLGLGRDMEVLGPPEVRARVIELADGVIERHPAV
jgi:predicted DNA-binding transcriptional regulator YafY